VLDDTEEKIPELDPRETVLHKPPISPEDKLMSQWFCFVQTADGKVVAVEHPAKENVEVVNFKKGIAAAFQANFKGTTVEVTLHKGMRCAACCMCWWGKGKPTIILSFSDDSRRMTLRTVCNASRQHWFSCYVIFPPRLHSSVN